MKDYPQRLSRQIKINTNFIVHDKMHPIVQKYRNNMYGALRANMRDSIFPGTQRI